MVQETLHVSDNSPAAMSPARISFSYDLRCRSDEFKSPPHSSFAVDFDFGVRKSSGQDSPSADELFSDGKIRLAEIKTISYKPRSPQNPAVPAPVGMSEKQSSEVSSGEAEEKEKQSGSGNGRSFWPFKRSSSLNCLGGHGSGLCLLPLLSRSHSTGSAGGCKRAQKPAPTPAGSSGNNQKPPVKRSCGGHGNGVRVNSVLHVPVGNIGSIFSSFNGRDNKNKIIDK